MIPVLTRVLYIGSKDVVNSGLVGGYFQQENPNEIEEIRQVAQHLVSKLAGAFGSGQDCVLELVEVLKSSTQVVAGTNHILDLLIKSSDGNGCEEVVKVCRNIKAFEPLPFRCENEESCIKLVNEEEITCFVHDEPKIDHEDAVNSGLAGGYFQHENPNEIEEILTLAKDITSKLGDAFQSGVNCDLELVEVLKASSQVVAGMNHKLDLLIKSSSSENGCKEEVKICKNIEAFEPLPFRCESEKSCVQLYNEDEITCFPHNQPQIAVSNSGLVGGYFHHENPNEKEEIKQVAKDIVPKLTVRFGSGVNCDLELIKVLKASTQVVSGVNYKMDLLIKSSNVGGCEEEMKICKGIEAFKPLPTRCENEESCIELVNEEEITCNLHDKPRIEILDVSNTVGGYSSISNPEEDENIKSLGEEAVSLLAPLLDSNCDLELIEIKRAHSQVVAGTNYLFDLVVKGSGDECEEKTKLCKNVKIFVPLRFQCQDGEPCLKLVNHEDITCGPEEESEIDIFELMGGYVIINEPNNNEMVQKDAEKILPLLSLTEAMKLFSSCNLELDAIIKASLQSVAGENYDLDLLLKNKNDSECDEEVIKCENVKFYIPMSCEESDCFELMEEENIICYADDDTGKVGDYTIVNLPNEDEDLVQLSKDVIDLLTSSVDEFDDDGGSVLVEILEASSQVVAGTNYKLALFIRCSSNDTKICYDIYVHKPLEFTCEDEDRCLELFNEDEVKCRMGPESLPSLGEDMVVDEDSHLMMIANKTATVLFHSSFGFPSDCKLESIDIVRSTIRNMSDNHHYQFDLKVKSEDGDNCYGGTKLCNSIDVHQPNGCLLKKDCLEFKNSDKISCVSVWN